MIAARGPAYYDASYERIIRLKDPVVWGLMQERCEKIAPYIAGMRVLDVACGLGLLKSYTDTVYLGIDFSSIAIDYAREHGDKTSYFEWDVFKWLSRTASKFDTVILSEILEHVAQPARLYELAAAVAIRRIIWTVPCNLPAPAHVWPTWTEQAVDLMLSLVGGECVVKERFGGEDGKRWWIVVQDVKQKERDNNAKVS